MVKFCLNVIFLFLAYSFSLGQSYLDSVLLRTNAVRLVSLDNGFSDSIASVIFNDETLFKVKIAFVSQKDKSKKHRYELPIRTYFAKATLFIKDNTAQQYNIAFFGDPTQCYKITGFQSGSEISFLTKLISNTAFSRRRLTPKSIWKDVWIDDMSLHQYYKVYQKRVPNLKKYPSFKGDMQILYTTYSHRKLPRWLKIQNKRFESLRIKQELKINRKDAKKNHKKMKKEYKTRKRIVMLP